MRRLSIFLLLLISCARSSKEASPTGNPVAPTTQAAADAQFWKWFATHANEAATISRADEPIANELAAALHKIDPLLTFEMGIGTKPKDLIISANGIAEAFPVVKRLVAAAPALPGWKVIAFRPRKQTSELRMDGRTVRITDLRFRPLGPPSGGKLDIAVYASGRIDHTLKSAVYLLLDSQLGECDVETRLGEIQILDGKQAPIDVRPLSKLAALVDAIR